MWRTAALARRFFEAQSPADVACATGSAAVQATSVETVAIAIRIRDIFCSPLVRRSMQQRRSPASQAATGTCVRLRSILSPRTEPLLDGRGVTIFVTP